MMPEDELDEKAAQILEQIRPQIDQAMLAIKPGGPEVTIVAGALYLSVLRGFADEDTRRLFARCAEKLSNLIVNHKATTARA